MGGDGRGLETSLHSIDGEFERDFVIGVLPARIEFTLVAYVGVASGEEFRARSLSEITVESVGEKFTFFLRLKELPCFNGGASEDMVVTEDRGVADETLIELEQVE